jgi:hypothetical protein
VSVNGWIKISRQLLDHPVVGVRKDAPYSPTEAWIWLIENAVFKPEIIRIRGRDIRVNRGELVAAQSYLARAWRWAPDRVRWFLDKLVRENMITKQSAQHSSIPTVITISNYETWQGGSAQNSREEHHTPDRKPLQQYKDKELRSKNISETRARVNGEFWQQTLNPQDSDYCLHDGVPRLAGATEQRWRAAFGGDAQRLDWALAELAGTVQPNSGRPLAVQIEAGLARIAGHKRERDQRYASAVKINNSAKPATGQHVGHVDGAMVRDLSESFADYHARMVREGKAKP